MNTITSQNSLQVIAQYVVSIVKQRQVAAQDNPTLLRPVIMIDGPAGTGKSTFTKNLQATLTSMGIQVCLFEQDRFGVFRDIRSKNKINPCSDLARDPQTVTKLKEVMEGKTAILPIYDPSTGQRLKERSDDPRSHLPSGDVILYEGVSSLSAVIYDNSKFSSLYQQAVPIRIFFRPDSSETLYASRLKRDNEERNVDKLNFDDNWDDSERNNWLYTMRGIFNANIIVTRSANNVFKYDFVDNIDYLDFNVTAEFAPYSEQNSRALAVERKNKLEEQAFNWFENYHLSLYGAFAFEKSMQDKNISLTVKQRDELARYFMQSLSHENGRYHGTAWKPYAADDNEVLPRNTISRFYAAFYRQTNSKPVESVDDLHIHKMHNKLDAQALSHDASFNSKIKIAVENALVAVVLDNLSATANSVLRVTKAVQSYLHPLFDRYLKDETTEQEKVIVEFIAAPFDPSLGAFDLGRIMVFENQSPSKKDIIGWLFTQLGEVNNNNFYTHMRLHIRFMDLLCEPKNRLDLSNVFDEKLISKYRAMFAEYRSDYVFNANVGNENERRGRRLLNSKVPTTSFGTYGDIHDLPQAFRQLIGKRELPAHLAGKSYIRAIPTTLFNQQSAEQDLPALCSGSGAIALLLCASTLVDFSKEELLKYHLTALANTIGGGHHTLNECIAVSQQVLNFDKPTVESLIPTSLREIKGFQQVIKLVNEHKVEIGNLWHQYIATAEDESEHRRIIRLG